MKKENIFILSTLFFLVGCYLGAWIKQPISFTNYISPEKVANDCIGKGGQYFISGNEEYCQKIQELYRYNLNWNYIK